MTHGNCKAKGCRSPEHQESDRRQPQEEVDAPQAQVTDRATGPHLADPEGPSHTRPGEMKPMSFRSTQAPLDRYPIMGGNAWLIQAALSQAFLLTGNEVYDTTFGTLTAGDIAWPDGTTGHYAATSLDSNGAVLGFTATYVGSPTRTVTATIPRNASSQVSGAMTVSVA